MNNVFSIRWCNIISYAFEADYAWIISWSTESVSKLRTMTKIDVTFHTWYNWMFLLYNVLIDNID